MKYIFGILALLYIGGQISSCTKYEPIYGIVKPNNGPNLLNKNTVYIQSDKMPNQTIEVEVFNLMGQNVQNNSFEPSTFINFDLNEKTGIYIVRVHTENQTLVQKVMISSIKF